MLILRQKPKICQKYAYGLSYILVLFKFPPKGGVMDKSVDDLSQNLKRLSEIRGQLYTSLELVEKKIKNLSEECRDLKEKLEFLETKLASIISNLQLILDETKGVESFKRRIQTLIDLAQRKDTEEINFAFLYS